MSDSTRRGFIIFGVMVFVSAVFCYWLPFVAMPAWGIGVGLPPISLPAEVLRPNFLGQNFDLTNSMTSLLVVDVIVLLIGFVINRAVSAQGIERFIPRGMSNFIEAIVEFWYGQARNVLGEHTRRVLPLALTVFLVVLTANWLKLLPGVETVGIMTCAEVGKAGYPLQPNNPSLLLVDAKDLKGRAGVKVSDEAFLACISEHPEYTPPLLRAICDNDPATLTDHQKHECAIVNGEHAAPAGGEHPEPAGTPAATEQHGALPAENKNISFSTTAGDTATAQEATANANLFNVVPYFRALATDLNMPLAMAIIVFLAVQVWGIQALGLPYFYKFINIPALGNMSKNPMGVMDFVVGLVDIISELSRLISLSFRLLGNLFAGGVLVAVMTFLVANVLPVVFNGLELFVGLIQAYVFAILTVMYASQAVTAHHGDDHDDHHDASGHVEPIEQNVDLP